MSGSTSCEAPPVYGHILELIRCNHEEIEKLEQLVMAELKTEEPSRMKQLLQGHRLRSITKAIILKSEKLVDIYDDVTTKNKIAPLPDQTATCAYFDSLRERKYQVNLSCVEYLEALREYLVYYFQRTEPLQDLDRILSKVETDFEEQYAQVEPAKLTGVIMPMLHVHIGIVSVLELKLFNIEIVLCPDSISAQLTVLEKKQSIMEAVVKKLCYLLDKTIERTKEKGDKKKALAFEEMEEDTESECGDDYNPVKRAMGWLGMPYWPYKLGLGQEYKCEICTTKYYWGKKSFERHLEEWCHKDGLSRLEIQGTEKFNEEAEQVWKRWIPKRQNHETEEHNSSQVPPVVAIPPPEIKTMLERTTLFLAKEDLEVEKRIVPIYRERASFKFLQSSDSYHSFYQYKITEYRAQNQDGAHIQSDARSGYDEFRRVHPPTLDTDKFTCRVPEGITAKELDIIKLTAEFWARFGRCFWEDLKERVIEDSEFEFMKNPRDHRFSLFRGLVQAYSNIFHPCKNPKEKLRKKTIDMETVLENSLFRLQNDCFQKKKRTEKMVTVSKRLSSQQLGQLSGMMHMASCPPQQLRQPKRQKFEEDEFLAQHPGRGPRDFPTQSRSKFI